MERNAAQAANRSDHRAPAGEDSLEKAVPVLLASLASRARADRIASLKTAVADGSDRLAPQKLAEATGEAPRTTWGVVAHPVDGTRPVAIGPFAAAVSADRIAQRLAERGTVFGARVDVAPAHEVDGFALPADPPQPDDCDHAQFLVSAAIEAGVEPPTATAALYELIYARRGFGAAARMRAALGWAW